MKTKVVELFFWSFLALTQGHSSFLSASHEQNTLYDKSKNRHEPGANPSISHETGSSQRRILWRIWFLIPVFIKNVFFNFFPRFFGGRRTGRSLLYILVVDRTGPEPKPKISCDHRRGTLSWPEWSNYKGYRHHTKSKWSSTWDLR